MTDEIINQAVDEAQTQAPAEVVAEEPIDTQPQATEEKEAPEPEESKEDSESKEPEYVPFPKKAQNLISRKEKKIWKLQASEAALKAELQKYKEQEEKAANVAPSEDAFENYGDFLEAKIKYGLKQEQPKAQETAPEVNAEQQAWYNERMTHAAQKATETAKTIPDYTATINENVDFINSLPEGITETLLEAENGGLALYALAKEGSLYDLSEMSERAAAMAIAKAEVRGAQYLKKPVTKAPAPIEGLKGVGQTNKTLNSMSTNELMKWVNS